MVGMALVCAGATLAASFQSSTSDEIDKSLKADLVVQPATIGSLGTRLSADKAKEMLVIKSALVSNERMQVPAWLEVDIEKLQGNVLSLPNRDQIDLDINEQLIVELYSK